MKSVQAAPALVVFQHVAAPPGEAHHSHVGSLAGRIGRIDCNARYRKLVWVDVALRTVVGDIG